MGDRALVRPRSVVSLAVVLGLGGAAMVAAQNAQTKPAPAANAAAPPKAGAKAERQTTSKDQAKDQSKGKSKSKPKPVPIETLPYRIRAWVQFDPQARLDAHGRANLLASWRDLVHRFIGAPWDLEVAEGPGPLATELLENLNSVKVAAMAEGFDKAWMVRVEPAGDGLVFLGRELDIKTMRMGPIYRREAPYPADAARPLLELSLDVFAPIAEIGAQEAGGVSIMVRGAALPAASPIGQVVGRGTVLRPIRIWQNPDGSVRSVEEVKRSFLRVKAMEGPVARCEIISALRDPLSRRTSRRNTLVALGVKPASVPTRFRYVLDREKTQPAAGYTLQVRPAPNGPIREIGMTDREGRIVLPPGFADGLVVFRLLAANLEPVDEFPAMPGETLEERTIMVRPLSEAVAFETELTALKDELVDLVAVRAQLEARLKTRAEAGNWDAVAEGLAEFKKLPPRSEYVDRLAEIRKRAETKQQENRRTPILTKTVMNEFDETQALIDRYLDDEVFRIFEEDMAEARSLAARKVQTKQRSIAKAAPRPTPAPAPEPSPSTTNQPVTTPAVPTPRPAAPKSGTGAVPF
jgi:hypothetical protein